MILSVLILLNAVLAPLGFLLVLFSLKNPDVCPDCGYDTRASRLRCPECGTDLAAVRASATTEQLALRSLGVTLLAIPLIGDAVLAFVFVLLGPVWSGFLFNTLFYATILWLLALP